MPFPIENFESFIDPVINRRGQEYFARGAIESLEEIEPGKWEARVHGTELYQVQLEVKEGVVDKVYCSCPYSYSYGGICKHLVAMIYLLRFKMMGNDSDANYEEGLRGKNPLEKSDKKKEGKKSSRKSVAEQVKEALERLSPEQIRSFLQEILEEDRYFRSIFMSRVISMDTPTPQTASDVRRQVKRMLQPAKNRRSIIYPNEAQTYLGGIQEMLSKAEQQLREHGTSSVIVACQVIIEELVPAFQYIDDSEGDVGNLVEWSFSLLNEAAGKELEESTRRVFYKNCLKQADDERYEGWGFHFRFLDLAVQLAKTAEEINHLESLLTERFEQSRNKSSSDFMSSYDLEKYASLLVELYEDLQQQEKQLRFMEENSNLSNIMEKLIHKAWLRKEYDKVRAYCEKAVKQFKSKPGLNSVWLEWLLKVAEAEENISEQRKYVRQLLHDTGSLDWYKRLKKLYDEKEWTQKSDELLKELQNQGRWKYSSLVPSICIDEKNWEGLFNYVHTNPDLRTLQHYDSWLKDHYFDELMSLYKKGLINYMKTNTGRNYYRETCRILKRLEVLGGTDTAHEVAGILQSDYKNRPALQEELMKAGYH